MTQPTTALDKAARDMVWTLFVRCQHDFEGHNLAAIERYFVRRWLRATPPEPSVERAGPTDEAWRAVRSALQIARQGPESADVRFVEALRTFGFTIAAADAPVETPPDDPNPVIEAALTRLDYGMREAETLGGDVTITYATALVLRDALDPEARG